MNKSSLRQHILDQRNKIHKENGRQFSQTIFSRFIALPEIQEKLHFFIYLHFKSEVETTDIIEYLINEGKKVYVPVTDKVRNKISAAKIEDLFSLQKGPFSILEPVEKNIIDDKFIECVIVPGAVFDRTGGRIGYGGGYYDRFFSRVNRSLLKIGLAYGVQTKNIIPQEKHDVPLDILITEEEVINIQK